MRIQNGTVLFPDGSLKPADLLLEGTLIEAVFKENATPKVTSAEETLDATDCLISPGFIDIHTHGACGFDFSDGNPSAIQAMAEYLLAQGVTDFLGTTMALDEAQLTKIIEATRGFSLENSSSEKPRATLQGINMEGPFFSKERKGAQNPAHILAPDLSLFQRLFHLSSADGNAPIRLIDLAPELPGAIDFIRKAKELCTVSLAHTASDYDTALRAFEAGASHITHLYNAMPPFLHREPGLLGAAAEKAVFVELICDGIHIHPSVIRNTFRWFGPERICLISDSIRACGLKDGNYTLGGLPVKVAENRATLTDGTLAGSTSTLARCVQNAVSFGIPAPQALLAATKNPAQAIGLYDRIGSIEIGKQANLLLLDPATLKVKTILHQGKILTKPF